MNLQNITLNTSSEKLAAAHVLALQAIEKQLAHIADKIGQEKQAAEGETILKESLSLPPDIPGRDALVAAGYTDASQLPTSGKSLEKIKGIGKVTANQILTYLKTR